MIVREEENESEEDNRPANKQEMNELLAESSPKHFHFQVFFIIFSFLYFWPTVNEKIEGIWPKIREENDKEKDLPGGQENISQRPLHWPPGYSLLLPFLGRHQD